MLAPIMGEADAAPTTEVPIDTQPTVARRAARAAGAIVIALLFAASSLFLFTRNNDFPLSYHPDEDGKVAQVVSPTAERNFHHPLLLVESAELARRWSGVSIDDARGVAIAGRWASATLASVGVFAAALLGYVAARWIGLAIVGTTIALCPPLLVYAHYLKEDAALISGLAVTTLGVGLMFATRRLSAQLGATLVLALGCAIAVSGKFVGAAAVVPALLAVVIAPLARWWQWPLRLVLFAAVSVAAAVAINARAFEDPWHLQYKREATSVFEWEYAHGTTGHSGVALPVPNAFAIRVAVGEMMPHLWAIAAIGGALLLGLAIRRRRWPISRAAIVYATLPITFGLVLAHNTIPFERYGLPITFFAYLLAGLMSAAGLAALAREFPRVGISLAALTVVAVGVAQGTRCLDFDRRFRDDSRQRLREWAAVNIPRGANVIADWYADLYEAGDPWRFPDQANLRLRLLNQGYAAGNGQSLDGLARRGVRYVIAVRSTFGRFLVDGIEPIEKGSGDWLLRTQTFYRELFDRGELVWSSIPNPPMNGYVDPEIRVYCIDALRPSNLPPPPPTPMERWVKEMERRRQAAATRPRQ